MLAILFANMIAPLMDYVVMKVNIQRRLKRQKAATGEVKA
jgi:Na+-transporting NADH:ubiquinone oxidoreductase subunit B